MEGFEQSVEHEPVEDSGEQSDEAATPDPTSESTDETPSSEEAASESPSEQSSASSESPEQDPIGEPSPDESPDSAPDPSGGLLTGTASELQPGVGGLGDHPAPAVVKNEDGTLHVAGEPPAGTSAGTQVPEGDSADLQSGDDVTDPEAREALNEVKEPDQIETERPDIGTE